MRILALETSTEITSIALLIDDVLQERRAPAGMLSSQWLLPAVRRLMAEADLALDQLDGISFGAGPGSFTGLRVACACAQGMAYGADLPLVPVSTLEALAHAAGAERVAACLDARMHEVYFSAYLRHGDSFEEVIVPGLHAPAEVPPLEGGGWVGCGSGFAAYGDALRTRLGSAIGIERPDTWPVAGSVARLAAPRLAAGQAIPAWEAAPAYIRDKVALKVCER
jgi:tRNA threonylcarbamoyladenosine biosynthesis protein TsaB